jgi:hypothetical protein
MWLKSGFDSRVVLRMYIISIRDVLHLELVVRRSQGVVSS